MVKLEDVPAKHTEEDISSDESEDMPTLEHADEQVAGRLKLNRAEKKARKAMEKIGMKLVPGVEKIVVKRGKAFTFTISKPDVMKSPTCDTYVIFGEIKSEEQAASAAANAARKFTHTPEVSKVNSAPTASIAEEEDESEVVDESGLEVKDIELIMSQVSCSRSKAAKALRAAKGDLVEAIMQLSA